MCSSEMKAACIVCSYSAAMKLEASFCCDIMYVQPLVCGLLLPHWWHYGYVSQDPVISSSNQKECISLSLALS